MQTLLEIELTKWKHCEYFNQIVESSRDYGYYYYCNHLLESPRMINDTILIVEHIFKQLISENYNFNLEIISKIEENIIKIHKVLCLFGCNLIKFITEEMKESNLIRHINVFNDIKTVNILLDRPGIRFQDPIKALYIIWLFDNQIEKSNIMIKAISRGFYPKYKIMQLITDFVNNKKNVDYNTLLPNLDLLFAYSNNKTIRNLVDSIVDNGH